MAPLIEVKNLKKYFPTSKGTLHAVDDVSFKIEAGKTLGLVGESGCGKSTLGRTIIHLHKSTDGQVFYDGEDVTDVKGKELSKLRRNCQIIFQDPYSSLNARMTVEKTITEPLKIANSYSSAELKEKTKELMALVGINERMRQAFPHELDGGRRQRVGIARALAMNPKFIVCDEPVSALDVSIQAQILNLLQDLQSRLGIAYMFVTHDLSVVRHISDDICVMYLGQVVEMCAADELFRNPMHPYTKALLSAIPSLDVDEPQKRIIMRGEITSPIDPPPGCRFAARCPYVTGACTQPQKLEETGTNHQVACCRLKEIG